MTHEFAASVMRDAWPELKAAMDKEQSALAIYSQVGMGNFTPAMVQSHMKASVEVDRLLRDIASKAMNGIPWKPSHD